MALQTAVGVAGAVEERAGRVRSRQRRSYDWEKVAWNGGYMMLFSLLTWGGVLAGNVILSMRNTVEEMQQEVTEVSEGKIPYNYFKAIYDYVEGEKKSWPLPKGTRLSDVMFYYRNNPNDWEAYKEKVKAQSPEWFAKEGKFEPVAHIKSVAENILDQLNNFYNDWGPILPIACLGYQAGVELVRVKGFNKPEEDEG